MPPTVRHPHELPGSFLAGSRAGPANEPSSDTSLATGVTREQQVTECHSDRHSSIVRRGMEEGRCRRGLRFSGAMSIKVFGF